MKYFPDSELVINSDGSAFHLHLKPEHLADKVILVGDRKRVNIVAAHFDTIENEVENREFHTITGSCKNKRITCLSHGIGCGNIDITVNELDALANINFKTRTELPEHRTLTMVRIGTCGALHPETTIGSHIVSVKSIGFDGVLNYYAARNSVCDLDLENAFVKHMNWNPIKGAPYVSISDSDLVERIATTDMVRGITVSCGGFYGPQGRQIRMETEDPRQNEKLETFRYDNLKIANFEMESSALSGLSSILGHKAVTCCLVLANRHIKAMETDYATMMDKLIVKVIDRI